MFSTLRTRFGIPGVISVIALVFAMFGGAYAASNSSNAGKATASAKAKKGPRGPKGATGPAGPAGAQGPAGPAGAKGDAGANGSNGAAGATGAKGATGVTGPTGPTGFSGFTETLPSGKTETGHWSIALDWPESFFPGPATTISYGIPLAEPSEHVKYLNQAETESSEGSGECELLGSGFSAVPVAPPGYLCVFTRNAEYGSVNFIGPNGAEGGHDTPTGASIWAGLEEAGTNDFRAVIDGTWAVTAK
jgi:hypothetical protein